MIRVNVRYLFEFRNVTNKKEEQLELPDDIFLEDLLNLIVEKYGDSIKDKIFDQNTGCLAPNIAILVDGFQIRSSKAAKTTNISNESVVVLSSIITGG